MATLFTKFYKWIFNLDRKRQYFYPLDEDLLNRDNTIKELAKKVQSQDAQLSKISAEERKMSLKEKEIDKEQEAIKSLNDRKKELDEKKYLGTFSFYKFFKKLIRDRKFRSKFEISDKDDSVIFGKFGDIVVFPDNEMGILDVGGRILAKGDTLNKIIYKPFSIRNQVRRKRFLLPCDRNFIGIPDLEEEELPECTYNEKTGKIRWAKIREKPLRQLLVDRELKISEYNKYIERLEITKSELVRKTKELKRENEILKNNKNTTEVELSKTSGIQKQLFNKMTDMQNKIEILTQTKERLEEMRVRLENVNKKLIEKVEEVGAQTQFRQVLGTVQNLIEWSKLQLGETVINPIEEKPIKVVVKPGERI